MRSRVLYHRGHNTSYNNCYKCKGIDISDEWTNNPSKFEEEIKQLVGYKKWIEGAPLQLDRIDNTRGYESGNIRFATRKTNINNRSNTRILEHDGLKLPLSIWAKVLKVKYETLATRHQRGWSDNRILTTPVREYRS